MKRRTFIKQGAWAAAALCSRSHMKSGQGKAALKKRPKPTPQQLKWQDMELGIFFHFDIPIYKPGWSWRSWKDLPAPDMYDPKKLNTDQWMEAAKAMGAQYAVFVAKHCSGFLQWQSDLYPYGVKQSAWRNGNGDVVSDFIESCRKYHIKPGLYASVTANSYFEVDNPGLVNRGQGGDPEKQAQYAEMCEQMLTELWSRYGDLFEVWFDGGALPPEEGGPDLVPIYRKYQPDALVFQGPAASIRWIGNERGTAPYPCWATVPHKNDYNGPGDPNGPFWLPAECDVPVRDHDWFWKPNSAQKLYSLESLIDMYYCSVGRNCNLLLNANPNPDGLIPEPDFKRYDEFGKYIRTKFSDPIARTKGAGHSIELEIKKPEIIDHVVIMEDIREGERIREYRVEGLTGPGKWEILAGGQSVGHKRIQKLSPIELSKVRLIISLAAGKPLIRNLEVYGLGQ